MPTLVSEEEIELAVAVAHREGWPDLGSPPDRHPPRTLDEAMAVARLQEARRRPAAGRREPARTPRWAWGAMIAMAVLLLGVCWWVSPGRTIAGLVVVVVFLGIGYLRRGPGGVRRRPLGA